MSSILNSNLRVSVVMPVYNQELYLEEAIDSILSQSLHDFELIIHFTGLTAPKGRTMGHAGAIVTSVGESAAEKVEILREAGVGIIVRPSEFGNAVAEALAKL